MPDRVLIIGYGNSIRGDDAFGPIVAERLAEIERDPRVRILSEHVLTPELAADIRDAGLVIFLDASADGAVGQVLCRQMAPDPHASLSMAHHMEPAGLLLWAQQAYQHVPAAYLISTRGADFDFADAQLSPAVATAVRVAVQQVQELVHRFLSPPAANAG